MRNLIKSVVLCAIVVAALTFVITERRSFQTGNPKPTESSWTSPPEPGAVSAAGESSSSNDDEKNSIEVYERLSPGVVNITTTVMAYNLFLQAIPQEGTGSGAIMDKEGHIV